MSLYVFSNNASALLASGITNLSTSITVQAGLGALFPAFSAGQIGAATLEDVSGNLEIVTITGRVGDTFTVVRGQEGTTAIAFASGSRFELRPTAGVAGTWLQKTGGDTISGTLNNNGVVQQGTTGSIQGGEVAGSHIRGAPGETDNEFFVPTGGAPPTIGTSPVLTKANFLNQLPSGVGAVITGMVLAWTGTSLNVPAGYHVCDGTLGTPDLRDKFILGAGGALPTSGGSSVTTTGATSLTGLSIGATALTVAQLPKHTHQILSSSDTLDGAGSGHALTGVNGSRYYNVGGSGLQTSDPGGHTEDSGGPNGAMNGDTHTHTLAGSSSHTHTYQLPPYQALFWIMKL